MSNNRGKKTDDQSSQKLLSKMPEHIREEAQSILEDTNVIDLIIDDVAACGVAGERNLVAAVYLVGTSRLLSEPLGAIVQSPTSTGKSYVVDKTAGFFPPEAVIFATAITPQALYYMAPGALSHKFVVAGERSRYHDDQTADATKALRELLSSGKLSKLVTETKGGAQNTRRVEQKGPIAYIESTTAPNIFAEDANRCLILTTDESPEQTRAILHRIASRYSSADTITAIIQKHHAIQRMLQQRPVELPFGEKLAALFPAERPEARRAFGQLFRMVQSSALLHQFQRTIDSQGRLIANMADYEIARRLLSVPLGRSMGGGISGGAIRFHARLHDVFGDMPFTTTEAVRRADLTRQTVNDHLWELSGSGAVTQIEKSMGCKPAIWHLERIDRNSCLSRTLKLPLCSDVDGSCQADGDMTQKAQKCPQRLQQTAASGGNPPNERTTALNDDEPF